MKIYQILVTIAYGDGVGNEVMAIYDLLRSRDYVTEIYAENIDSRLSCKDLHSFKELPELTDDDVIIYHLSTGTELNELFPKWKGKKLIIYHNITPPEWFDGYDEMGAYLCSTGLEQTKKLASAARYCIADSQFNKDDLKRMGYTCPIDVLPIIIPFQDYDKEPDRELIDLYSDGYTNILFTGRIAPNKCQQDVIKAFANYQGKYNPKSRLFLVGAYAEDNKYYQFVKDSVEESGAQNVIFSGHIKFHQILSYYHVAHMFLCMSEHEGFCIPLLEAMYFKLPIVAYNSTAVPGTLGGSGILVEEKAYDVIADKMNSVLTDSNLREEIIAKQNERVKMFFADITRERFMSLLEQYMAK